MLKKNHKLKDLNKNSEISNEAWRNLKEIFFSCIYFCTKELNATNNFIVFPQPF